MASKNTALKSVSRDREAVAGRMIGLGASPSNETFMSLSKCSFQQVPVIEYVTWTVPLPLSDDQIESTFGNEIDVLQNPKAVSGVASVDSSFVVNGILQTDMFVIGFGIHAFGEPMSFSQIGNSVASAGTQTAPLVSPDVFSANDALNGALSGVLGVTAGIEPAQMEWGFADWQAMWHLVNAYQFQWKFQQRHLLINELAADVSYFGPYAEGQGMGTSDASVQQYVRQINDQYAGLGASSRFLPVSHRRVGSVNAGGTGATIAANTGVFHPTRDYDLAPVSWGGIRNQGSGGCCMPFRKLNKPVLLERGIPIGMILVAQDSYHQEQMQRYLSISEGADTNQVANILVDQNINGYSVATGNAGLELTLDTGGNQFANESVQTNRALYKGGTLKLAILIKGFEVWGPWKKYFASNAPALTQYVDVPSITGQVSGLAGIQVGG